MLPSNPLRFFLFIIYIISYSSSAQVNWSHTGPGGGGWLTSMTVVNDALHTTYVGCDVGGIYKSTDNGQTWEIKDRGLSIYFTHDIAYDFEHPDTLYIATRGGVYKSVDGGDNWTPKRSGFPEYDDFAFSAPVSDIAVDPNHLNVIYAGIGVPNSGYDLSSYHWETAGIKGAIYKSVDYGENWTLIQNTGINPEAMIYSMAINPDNSDIVYAATSTGIYKSTDAGATWTAHNNGLPHLLTMRILIDPSNTHTLYVSIWAEPGSSNWEGGIYKSIDAGNTWIAKNNGLPQVMGDVNGLTCNYPSILIDKNNPSILYAGNKPWSPDPGVYKTTNGGDSWSLITLPDSNMDNGWIDEAEIAPMCMAIDPNDSNSLYFGTSMHLIKTDNAGSSWHQVYTQSMGNDYWKGNGFETTVTSSIAIDPNNSNNVYAGYWDIGLFKSTDGGSSFKNVKNGMIYHANIFDMIVDPDNSSVVYAACGWWEENLGRVYKSTDYGESWAALDNGIPDAQNWSIALDKNSPSDARILYAVSYENGIYKTLDGGLHWFPVNNGLGVSGNLQVRKITIDPNNSSILYAGIEAKIIEDGENLSTVQGGLFKSVDAGAHWMRIDTENPQLSVWDIAVSPANSNIIYTAVSSEYDHTQETYFYGGIYKSTDAGAHWQAVNNGFGEAENLNVSSIAISPYSENILYATTIDSPYHDICSGRGIFKSTDAGVSWSPINTGLGVLYYDTIKVDPSNPNILYAGSSGNGLLKGFDNDILNVDNPGTEASISLTVKPNPFTEKIQFDIVIQTDETISIDLYDIKGQLLTKLAEETFLKKGKHRFIWNVKNNFKPGLYFYRVQSSHQSISGKIIRKD